MGKHVFKKISGSLPIPGNFRTNVAIPNGRLGSCLGRVFNYKLGCIAILRIKSTGTSRVENSARIRSFSCTFSADKLMRHLGKVYVPAYSIGMLIPKDVLLIQDKKEN